MYRLTGISRAIREGTPPALVDAAGVVTLFGGATALLFVLSVAYWVGDRRRVLTLVGYAFVALGTVLLLKTLIGAPRPPAGTPYEGDPYGFPSGHATAAAVVYGGAAVVYERLDARMLGAVGVAVAAIALSRVVLGVHYLGDVLVGAALGAVLVSGLWVAVGRDPLRVFAFASAVGAVAVAVGAPESLLALGGSVGGLLGGAVLDRVPDPESRVEAGLLVVLGVGTVLALDGLLGAVASPALLIVGNALLVSTIVLLPVAVAVLPAQLRDPDIHYY
ncbi:phosphatase PAP2 family protein [Halapricum sp. CBA1109]|uniref:phosphatase PAP2 family protein n=1 Tax=Halapricum sp. CBA1109 TaxID=2668068 RepID=UPI0012FC79B3|nr:phosphatase PAP2 family protein [Halapricum sp. CBA1109]